MALALSAVMQRHEILRTTFSQEGDDVFQVVHQNMATPFEYLEHCEQPQELAPKHSQMKFDLEQGPLWHVQLVQVEANQHVLNVNLHHIIADGWSIGRLIENWVQAYQDLVAYQNLPALAFQYKDFAFWQRSSQEKLKAQMNWWREALKAVPEKTVLPLDRPRSPGQIMLSKSLHFELDAESTNAFLDVCEDLEMTPFMTVLACLVGQLSRFDARHSDVVIGAPIVGRSRPEWEPVIGLFLNTLALRVCIDDAISLKEHLFMTREHVFDEFQNEVLPFEELVRELQPERNLSITPLFQVLLVYQNTPETEVQVFGDGSYSKPNV